MTMLPQGYIPYATLDLSRNWKLLIGLQLAGTLLLVVFGWAGYRLVAVLRPDALDLLVLNQMLTTTPDGGFMFHLPLALLVGVLLATPLVLVLHEATHGLFFWLFGGVRPHFGFKGLYAYAALPSGVYMRRNPYLLVGLAPLLLLSVFGLALLLVVPVIAIPTLLCALVFNAAGAVGDLLVVGWLLRFPPSTLVADCGDAMTVYCTPSRMH